MKNNQPTLRLRAQSVRNLTAAELRAVNGGNVHASGCDDTGTRTCDGGTSDVRFLTAQRTVQSK